MATKDFLSEIYKGCVAGFITLTSLPDRQTKWFKVSEIEKLAKTAEIIGQKTNVFFGVGLRNKVLPNNLRGSEKNISCITTLYADIDVKGDAHAQKSLPGTIDEAVNFLNNLKIKPSIIVSSGNGIHSYWLLDKPFKIETEEDKNYVAHIFKGFGKYVNCEAKNLGWRLDNVYDLARILRVPGTINHKLKNNVKCEVIQSNLYRYTLESFNQDMHSHGTVCNAHKNPQGVEKSVKNCEFLKYCVDNAADLPEPMWHAMITNLAPIKGSSRFIHEFSKSYPRYNFDETERKIQRAITENKPHTCEYIRENLNFDCGKNCFVKAPIVYGLPSLEERFKELVSREKIYVEDVLSTENMKLCAWAKSNLPSEYAKLKVKLKGKINLRDFEKAVRHEVHRPSESKSEKSRVLKLENVETYEAVIPQGWNVSMNHGVQKILRNNTSDEFVMVCSCPLIISRRFENIDDGTHKVEVKFLNHKHWKTVIAPRSHIFNRTSIIKYADSGLPVSSGNASDVVKYLSDYESTNDKCIPFVKSISRIGWVRGRTGQVAPGIWNEDEINSHANEKSTRKLEFFPYLISDDAVFETEYKEASNLIDNTGEYGSFDIWKQNAQILRNNQFGRFLLATSFASPLLEILNHRVFFVHIWHDSKSGKTAAIKMAISVWGNPTKLMGSFNATSVGLERMAGTLKHLPFAIDELQVLNNKRLSIENIIYSLGNGFGRLRGAKEGGIQETASWRNNIITSGEQPMSKESSNDGVLTRVLELYGKPVDDVNVAHTLHLVSENHYGFAGKIFIQYLISDVLKVKGKAHRDFDNLRKDIEKHQAEDCDNTHLDNVAIVCLGDYYSSIAVFGKNEREAWSEAVNLRTQILQNCKKLQKADTIDRAWDFVTGWITSNKNRFLPDSTPCYGKIEQDAVYIIPNILRTALEENGFDYSKVTRGFKDRNLIEAKKDNKGIDRTQVQKKINGINQRCFCIKVVTDSDKDSKTNPLV